MTAADFEQYRHDILRLAEAHGLSNVRLFGSWARGSASGESDIDFLVDLNLDRTLYDICGFVEDVEALLGRPVDAFTPNSLKPYIREQALKDAQLL